MIAGSRRFLTAAIAMCVASLSVLSADAGAASAVSGHWTGIAHAVPGGIDHDTYLKIAADPSQGSNYAAYTYFEGTPDEVVCEADLQLESNVGNEWVFFSDNLSPGCV